MTRYDYFAHNLYMFNEDGTWLDFDSVTIFTETTTLPLTQIYRRNQGSKEDRIGWASYRPHQIEVNTVYTITLASEPGTDTEDESYIQENFGLRLPPDCTGPCAWVPINTCRINEGDADLILRNNQSDTPIWRMISRRFDCAGLAHQAFLPLMIQP